MNHPTMTFTLDARKPDERWPANYDRIILWLERSAQNPGSVNLYLLYGRYEAIFGKPIPYASWFRTSRTAYRLLKMALLALAEN
jgi:hypothetical protein